MTDIICLTLLALGAIRGYRKGAIVAVFSLLAIVVGTIAAMKLSGTVAHLLFQNSEGAAWVPLVTYIILFIGIVWLVRRGAKLVEGLAQTVMLGLINRLLGAALYMFIAAFIWSAVLYLANGAGLLSEETKTASVTYGYVAPVAPWVFAHMGAVLPFVKNIFGELGTFFDSVNGHVGTH